LLCLAGRDTPPDEPQHRLIEEEWRHSEANVQEPAIYEATADYAQD